MSTAHEQAARDWAAWIQVVVRGWHPGDGPLNSHSLCLLLRDGASARRSHALAQLGATASR